MSTKQLVETQPPSERHKTERRARMRGMGAEKTDAVQVAPQNQDRQARVAVRLTADHYQGGRGQG